MLRVSVNASSHQTGSFCGWTSAKARRARRTELARRSFCENRGVKPVFCCPAVGVVLAASGVRTRLLLSRPSLVELVISANSEMARTACVGCKAKAIRQLKAPKGGARPTENNDHPTMIHQLTFLTFPGECCMFAAGKSSTCGAFFTVLSHLSNAGIGLEELGDCGDSGDSSSGSLLREEGGRPDSARVSNAGRYLRGVKSAGGGW